MTLPATEQELAPLHKEILSFLWIQTLKSETIQKRCLVASKRLFASFNKGGLQIQHPQKVAEEHWLDLIPKYLHKLTTGNSIKFNRTLEHMLHQEGWQQLGPDGVGKNRKQTHGKK
jgi:hypothetical protein